MLLLLLRSFPHYAFAGSTSPNNSNTHANMFHQKFLLEDVYTSKINGFIQIGVSEGCFIRSVPPPWKKQHHIYSNLYSKKKHHTFGVVQIKFSITMTFAGHPRKSHPLKSSTEFRPLIFSKHGPGVFFLCVREVYLLATALRPTIMKVELGWLENISFLWGTFSTSVIMGERVVLRCFEFWNHFGLIPDEGTHPFRFSF